MSDGLSGPEGDGDLACLSERCRIELGALEELDSNFTSNNAEFVGICFLEKLAVYSLLLRAEVQRSLGYSGASARSQWKPQ